MKNAWRRSRWFPLLLEGGSIMVGLWIAVFLFRGIEMTSVQSLLAATLVLMASHFALRPVLLLLAFPLIVLTLGLGIILVNALFFYFTAFIVTGFDVHGFGWAMLGGVVVSISSLLSKFYFGVQIVNSSNRGLNVRFKVSNQRKPDAPNPSKRVKSNDDIIDI